MGLGRCSLDVSWWASTRRATRHTGSARLSQFSLWETQAPRRPEMVILSHQAGVTRGSSVWKTCQAVPFLWINPLWLPGLQTLVLHKPTAIYLLFHAPKYLSCGTEWLIFSIISIKSNYPEVLPSSPADIPAFSESLLIVSLLYKTSTTNKRYPGQKKLQHVCYNFDAITCWQVKLKVKLASLMCQEKRPLQISMQEFGFIEGEQC